MFSSNFNNPETIMKLSLHTWCVSLSHSPPFPRTCAVGVKDVFKINAWAISVNVKRHVFSKEIHGSSISHCGERVRKGWLKKLRLCEGRLSALFNHLRNSFNATFFFFLIKLSLIRQIKSESFWTPPVFMEEYEGECLQCLDCDALVAIAKYHSAFLVIHSFSIIHSFIKHYWVLTMFQLMGKA